MVTTTTMTTYDVGGGGIHVCKRRGERRRCTLPDRIYEDNGGGGDGWGETDALFLLSLLPMLISAFDIV